MTTRRGSVSTSHTHLCVVCDTPIPCESPEDSQHCTATAIVCSACDGSSQDVSTQTPFKDQAPSGDGSDSFDDVFGGEDRMGEEMFDATQRNLDRNINPVPPEAFPLAQGNRILTPGDDNYTVLRFCIPRTQTQRP